MILFFFALEGQSGSNFEAALRPTNQPERSSLAGLLVA